MTEGIPVEILEKRAAEEREPRIVKNQDGVEVLKAPRMGEQKLAEAFDDVEFPPEGIAHQMRAEIRALFLGLPDIRHLRRRTGRQHDRRAKIRRLHQARPLLTDKKIATVDDHLRQSRDRA